MFIWGKLSYFADDFKSWGIFYLAALAILAIWILRIIISGHFKISLNLWMICFLSLHILMGLEIYYRYVFDISDDIFYLLTTRRWVQRHVQINGFGYRDDHFFQDKDEKELRIAVVGDSFTWGQGIENYQDRFSNILEQKLAERCGEPNRVKAYNLAQPGENISNYLDELIRMNRFKFDGVIVGYYLNDIESGESIRNKQYCYQDLFCYKNNKLLSEILDNSYSLQYLWTRVNSRFIFPKFNNACYKDSIQSKFEDPEIWLKHLISLKEIIDYNQKRNIKTVVAIFPFLNQIGPDYPAYGITSRLTKFLEDNHVPFVDLTLPFSEYPAKDLIANPHDLHPSELAHRVAAEELFKLLDETKEFKCKI